MNRRELLASVAAMLTTPALREDDVSAAIVDDAPALIVLTAPGKISDDSAARLSAGLQQQNPWPNAKIIVLGDGLTLHAYDTRGRLINAPIPKRRRAKPRPA